MRFRGEKVGGAGARALYKYHEKKSFTERRVLGGEIKEVKKGHRVVGMIGMVLLMLAVLCGSSSAMVLEELHTVKNGTVKGGVYVGGGHGSDYSPYTQNFSVPNGTILWSRLYVGVTGGGHRDGWLNITYWNGTGNTERNQYLEYDYDGSANDEIEGYYVGCGRGYYWKYWNVTDITNNGANSATVTTSGFSDGRINGIALITVYDDGGEDVTYWINQGYIQMGDVSSYPCCVLSNTTWFNGTMDTSMNSTLWTLYITGTEGEWDYLYFNGHKFATDDAADGGGSTPDSTWSNGHFDIDAWTVDKTWLNPSINNATFQNNESVPPGERGLRAVGAVLINKEPKPDLNVSEINPLVEREGQTPIALVANHTYTINATIINNGERDATGFNVTLHENGTLRNDTYLSGLDKGKEKVVQFNWTNLSGVYELKVTADAYDAVNESDEGNNASTKIVTVLPDNVTPPDIGLISSDITFLPSYGSTNTNTTIRARITNWGTTDASEFNVSIAIRNNTNTIVYVANTTTSLDAMHYRVIEFEYNASLAGSPYNVTIVAWNVTGETALSNNTASRSLTIISCRILDSHHYGNTSAYNGTLSNYTTVNMFDVTKLVPENTTPVVFLESVTRNVILALDGTPLAIDGLENGKEGGKWFFWTPFVNGIPIAWHNWTTYPLHDGDVLHWDIMPFISEKKFRPRLVTDYPEPFLHGYNGTVWSTTIVYPEEFSYPEKANAVKTRLNASGVPNERISVVSVENVTDAEKGSNNLILLGTPANNPLIAEVSSQHLDVGLPVYFSFSDSGKQMIDDSDDVSYEVGGVVEACDNPWNGSANWRETGPSVWLASGIEDYWAYKTADMLTNDMSKLNRFWIIRKPYLIPILNPNGTVTLDWGNWTGGSTYEIYITNNLTAGFPATPNAMTTEKSWTDMNAADDEQRYYKVVNETIEGIVTKIAYELKRRPIGGVGPAMGGNNWISAPNMNPPIVDQDQLIKHIRNNGIPPATPTDSTKVAWWNSTSQQALSYSYIPGLGYMGDDFAVKPARGYEVTVHNNTTWTIVGWVPEIDPIELIGGNNWIGVPFNTTINNQNALIRDIRTNGTPPATPNNTTKVAWWDPETQQALSYSYIPGLGYMGDNFAIRPARGYEVYVETTTKWTPR